MDRVANQLQTQMRSANQKLRRRAAQMLSPLANRGGRAADARGAPDAETEVAFEADIDAYADRSSPSH